MKFTPIISNSNKSRWLLSAVLPLALITPAATSFAQTSNTTTQDEIVVTGSRIRRSNINTAMPVQGLDVDDIESSGTVDVGELLTQIPGVDFSLSPESTGLSTQNPGLSTINLRGLGGDRTLVLIDGRRAVSNSGNGERVSLDTIPSGFVKRVEVTTGGASAIYGADAIAGVANIILRNDLDGVRAGYRYGKADASGEQENTIDLTIGKNFDNDRGNIMLGVTYDDETAVFADDTRPESIAAVSFNSDPTCVIAGTTQCGVNLSSFLPGGRFEGDDAWNVGGVWFNDKSLAPNDGRTPSVGFETGLDGYNFRPGRTLSPAAETLALAARGHYDLTDNITAFADVFYTQVDTTSVNASRTAASTTDIGPSGNSIDIGSISSSHPFIPAEVEETRSGSISWRRRFSELGMDIKENERDTLRAALGLNGSLDNGWDWATYATYGKFKQEQTQLNALNYQNVRNALRIEDDGTGGYQCTDAAARADGCVPLNIFGEGSITDEMADYIRYTGRLNQEREQTIFAGNVNGDLFELPSGAVKSAFGFEYRKESQTTIGDPDVGDSSGAPEFTSISVIPSIEASFDVIEAFGELDIPIIMDKPGVHALTAQLAGRVGDYSTIGTIFSYNVGGSYAPTTDIRFRAQYSRSQRAPNITEYFSDKRGDFDDLTDPCDGLSANGTGLTGSNAGAFTTNCLAESGIQAFFADPNNAGLAFDAGGSSVFGPNAGNNTLSEETADTITIGAVFTPEAIPGFSLIVDYYRIDIEGAIGTVSTQTTVDLCYADTNYPNNRFCDVITRDASDGQVSEVVNREENLNSVLAKGFDVSVNYDLVTDSIPGDIDVNFIYTRSLANEAIFEGLNGPELSDSNGEIGTPKDRFRARLGWDLNDFRVTGTWNYQSGGVDDITVSPSDLDYFDSGSQSYFDIYSRYRFDNKYNTEIYGGVKNLTDHYGPIVPTNLDHGSSRNITSAVNRTIGREFYVGIRARW